MKAFSTRTDAPRAACIPELFAAQVARTPEAITLVFDGRAAEAATRFSVQQLSYGELNARANRLARLLVQRGVGPEVRVGVCLERSLELVVALLGILKASGVYLPLDPSYPSERLAFILEDAQVPVLLTHERLLGRLPACQAQVMYLDHMRLDDAAVAAANLAGRATPDQLAYIIYTSGSTGKPKGILIHHRGVCNVISTSISAFGLDSECRVLQLASFSFDASVLELFLALFSGASLHLVAPESVGAPTALAQLIQSHAITTMALPPSLLEVLPHEAFPALQTIIVGGERCSSETFASWAPGRRFYNAYAPTEATIYASVWSGTAVAPQGPPLGRPIANMQLHLLDAQLQPVPTDVRGEIYLGGVGLARGYLNRPDLTAERFVPNPFAEVSGVGYQVSEDKTPDTRHPAPGTRFAGVSGVGYQVSEDKTPDTRHPAPGTRLYRTGDLARYLPDGALEFLGRVDHQMKVRGFRIELGEIEMVLGQHPSVRECVVQVREGSTIDGTDKRLVAYVVPTNDNRRGAIYCAPTTSDLRDFIKSRLPSYMMPSVFVTLSALPLTLNGKIDRAALPAPETDLLKLASAFAAPTSATEQRLAAIWAELLGLSRVGVNDNFFEIGGHSLLAARLLLHLRDAFALDLPLRHLFDTPTVAGLACLLDSLGQDDAATTASFTNLEAEAVLDPLIMPSAGSSQVGGEPSAIFVTGTTGFLGAFLLYELLVQTRAVLHCLVRAASPALGRAKIQKHLEAYELWDETANERIVPVIGDLGLPLFGLSEEAFQALADSVETIYHNGALVNLLYPYEALKPTNVLGTQEVLRLACTGTLKPLHYISTLSIFSSFGCTEPRLITEEDEPDDSVGLYSGYEQSKWVADKLVRIARSRGLPANIYRLATVSGDSQTGRSHPGDYISRLLKGCIQLGSARDYEQKMFLTPVDFVGKAIVYLSRRTEVLGHSFHLINPQPMRWSELLAWMGAFGYPLELRSFDAWCALLNAGICDAQENALTPFVPMYFDERVVELERANSLRFLEFACADTLALLAEGAISCPPVDGALLNAYFSYFIETHFLAAPQRYPQEPLSRAVGE